MGIRVMGAQPVFADKEAPTGAKNSVNTTFTLAGTSLSGLEYVYLNGQLLQSGGIDYTITGNTITFVTPPDAIDKLVVSYRK